MITGHIGVAAAAATRRELPLLWLLSAAVAPDAVDVAFALSSACNPFGLYSHSIPAAALLATVLGGAAFLATGRAAAGLLTAAVVMLHLPLDLVTGRKIYWPGGDLLGLQWYTSGLRDFLAEVPLLAAGWWMLRRSATPPRWVRSWPTLAALVLLQGGFDLFRPSLKPTGCPAASASRPARGEGT